jgi:hypothetical protein
MRNLKYLWMSKINTVGEIPDYVSAEPTKLLNLSSNRLNGTISSGLRSLRNLEILYLDWNYLCGQISGPTEAINLSKSILQITELQDLYQRNLVS